MGFGSGGGGFTPSPNNVPGSTTAGTDKDTDTHQFTGSVDITGSLTLNGSSITGGGGGGTPGGSDTQIQYNNGGAFGGASALVYDDVNNHVGVGVADPDVILEVLDTSTQQKWSYDADSFATLTVAEDSNTTLATGENGNITLHAGPTGDIFLVADGGQVNLQNPLGTNKLAFDVENAAGLAYISNVRNNDLIFRVGTNVKEVFRLDQSEGALFMSGNFAGEEGAAPIHFRDTATKINSPGANRLAFTAPTLEVSGNLHVSGTYGSTAIETLAANGTISANTGLTLVDASSSLAVNNTLIFSIADGTFAGQEKKIRGLIISGSDGANSTGINIFGSNIDSPPSLGGNGQIVLSSSNPAAGPVFNRAGCTLIWDGTKWLPVGNFNFDINNTGRSFI